MPDAEVFDFRSFGKAGVYGEAGSLYASIVGRAAAGVAGVEDDVFVAPEVLDCGALGGV